MLALLSMGVRTKGEMKLKQYKPAQIEAAREKFYAECGVRIEDVGGLVVDEISFVTAATLGHVDWALRVMTGNEDVLCGGIPLLLCGDNHQKPPPGDTPWYR